MTSKGPSGYLVADNRPVVGWKVPGRTAQGTVPFTKTYCEYGANHLPAVCGGSAAFWLITLTRLEYSQYRGCADGQSRCPDTVAKKYTSFETLTPGMLHELIEKIVVHEGDKSSGHRIQKIDIYYSFVGDLETSHVVAQRNLKTRKAA